MTTYTVDVTIGSHSWTFEHTAGEAADTVTVLDGLRFGWSMPTGLGPVQPDPMTAALAISVPDFVDAADIDTGTIVGIEIRFDPDAEDPTFAFYGRVSDGVAVPRTAKAAPAGRSGVTISLLAVDYTVDLADLEDWAYGAGTDLNGYAQVLTQLWSDRPTLGTLPEWPGGFDPNGPAVEPGDSPSGVLEVIKAVLLVAVDAASTKRVILAPFITGGALDVQHYAFDAVTKNPTSLWTLHSNAIRRDTLKWLRSKRRLFNTLEVTGAGDTVPAIVTWPDVGLKVLTDRLSTISSEQDQLDDVADFYLPDPGDSGSWTLDQFTVQLSDQLDDADLAALPLDLMPRWYLDPSEAERSSCYGKAVKIVGLPDDLNPFTDAPDLQGILDAAAVSIAGGRVTLETRLRRLQPVETKDEEAAHYSFGGYALAPLGGLATNPT